MKILIIGGTIFVGRHLVEVARRRGHEITLFNRGQHNADLYPDIEKLRGDRKTDLSALKDRRWDAVIDTCGYVPRVVRASAEALQDAVNLYVFISSVSVYQEFPGQTTLDETSPVGVLTDPTTEEVTGESYGPLKALCEQTVSEVFPGRDLNIRPGLIVGPNDPTDRFTYWPVRVARGGAVLAPGRPSEKLQFIDVRDLAEWTIRLIEENRTGVFNAAGPVPPISTSELLEICRTVSGSDAVFHWADKDFLAEQNVSPWQDMPVWIPDTNDIVNLEKAVRFGLQTRPVAETVADTLAWARTRPADHKMRAGLDPQREQEVLTELVAKLAVN